MKEYYYCALVALTVWLSSVSTDTWAGRTARRAAEVCKSEDCDGGDGGVGFVVTILFIIGLLGYAAIQIRSDERELRHYGKTGTTLTILKENYKRARKEGFKGTFGEYVIKFAKEREDSRNRTTGY